MKTYNFIMRVLGSAKGTVNAKSEKEARRMIEAGQWDDIDIDIEDVVDVENLIEKTKQGESSK